MIETGFSFLMFIFTSIYWHPWFLISFLMCTVLLYIYCHPFNFTLISFRNCEHCFLMFKLIQLGQALSTRPDILPQVCIFPHFRIYDQFFYIVLCFCNISFTVESFYTCRIKYHRHFQLILQSIYWIPAGCSCFKVFADIIPEPIASTSLGQVYKGLNVFYFGFFYVDLILFL